MNLKDIINAIYRHHQRKKQRTNKETLTRLNLPNLANRENISTNDVKIVKLNNMSRTDPQRFAKLRGIKNYSNLTKESLIYTLLRLEKSLYENNYLKYATGNINDKLKAKINDVRTELAELGKAINKIDRKNIREELNDIEKSTRLTRSQKGKLYNCLIEISNDIGYKKKYKRIDFDG